MLISKQFQKLHKAHPLNKGCMPKKRINSKKRGETPHFLRILETGTNFFGAPCNLFIQF
jgi:hypothetical protein